MIRSSEDATPSRAFNNPENVSSGGNFLERDGGMNG